MRKASLRPQIVHKKLHKQVFTPTQQGIMSIFLGLCSQLYK